MLFTTTKYASSRLMQKNAVPIVPIVTPCSPPRPLTSQRLPAYFPTTARLLPNDRPLTTGKPPGRLLTVNFQKKK